MLNSTNFDAHILTEYFSGFISSVYNGWRGSFSHMLGRSDLYWVEPGWSLLSHFKFSRFNTAWHPRLFYWTSCFDPEHLFPMCPCQGQSIVRWPWSAWTDHQQIFFLWSVHRRVIILTTTTTTTTTIIITIKTTTIIITITTTAIE